MSPSLFINTRKICKFQTSFTDTHSSYFLKSKMSFDLIKRKIEKIKKILVKRNEEIFLSNRIAFNIQVTH